MTKYKIGFIGSGWGAVAALKGLKTWFDITCLSTDEAVIKLLGADDVLVKSISDIPETTIVMAGNLELISEKQLREKTFINIHYSLLPKYRGLHALAWAVLNHERQIGLTVHIADSGIDSGPIIHQKSFENDFTSSLKVVTDQFNDYVENNIANIVTRYLIGQSVAQPQDHTQATWVGRRNKKHNQITFQKNLSFYTQLFRVLQPPYPYPFVRYKNQEFTVKSASFHHANIEADVARILNVNEMGIWVHVKGGYIVIHELYNDLNNPVFFKHFKIGTYFND